MTHCAYIVLFAFCMLWIHFPASGQPEKLWETTEELITCESVCYAAKGDFLFASCIHGIPSEKDGKGFIARISMQGEIIDLQWISGLNAPKGMGISGDFLYVTDITEVVQISMVERKVISTIPVENAQFLNDITVDENGKVYISDMMSGKIHILYKESVITPDFGPLERPNGLCWHNGLLYIGTANGIMEAYPDSGDAKMVIANTGSIDGLEADGKGGFIISDWQGKIQRVHPDKEPVVLLNTTGENINAADIEFIPEQNLLLVPTFFHNTVSAYQIR
ncbi:MAG: hypothetical protein JXA03_14810 [Bacteroidales bacterium]|nr:hypothetical protein [Bacteroidales bacterium]